VKTLLCFGDSNTHGTIPMRTRDEVSRYALGQRWPGVLQAALGADWWVIEEGLPGRTSSFDDPVEGEDRNALRYWQACLQSHRPVDAIVIMLGTNDLKARFMATPSRISQGVATLIDMALDNTPPGGIHPLILVVTPAPIRELGFFQDLFAGGQEKSQQLSVELAKLGLRSGVRVLHAEDYCEVSDVDGIHLDAHAHRQLGQAIFATLHMSGH
jgi:lysophospholipase L1-like esterase